MSNQVLQEVRGGHGVGLSAAAKVFPGRGTAAVNASTLYRWCAKGVLGPTRERVKLEHVRLGSRILTSWPAIERFVAALSADITPVTIRTPAQRHRASTAAEAELIAAGA